MNNPVPPVVATRDAVLFCRTIPPIRDGALVDAPLVIYRLEEAGRTLLAMPRTGHGTGLRLSKLDVMRSVLEDGVADTAAPLRPAVPSSAQITRMDEAFSWVRLLPPDRVVFRRIIGARALVSPTTERHLYSWRRLATLLGADHKAIQRWHAQAVGMIVRALNT